ADDRSDRSADCEARGGARPLVPLPAHRLLRRHRHREPLLDRRCDRRPGRRPRGGGLPAGPGPRPARRLVLAASDHLTARHALRRYAEPGLAAAALGAVYLITHPDSADHAAQVFRSGLFDQEGLSTWDNFWFGGHHLPGYGLILPALGSLIGPRVVGVL